LRYRPAPLIQERGAPGAIDAAEPHDRRAAYQVEDGIVDPLVVHGGPPFIRGEVKSQSEK
jgi:hypothetical protein